MQFIIPIYTRWDNRMDVHENTIMKEIPKSGMVYRSERLNRVQTNILVFFEPSSIDYATRNRVSSFFFNQTRKEGTCATGCKSRGRKREEGEKPRRKRLVSPVLFLPCSGRCPIKSLVLATPIKTLLNIHPSHTRVSSSKRDSNGTGRFLLLLVLVHICPEQTRSRRVIKLTLIIRARSFIANYETYSSFHCTLSVTSASRDRKSVV